MIQNVHATTVDFLECRFLCDFDVRAVLILDGSTFNAWIYFCNQLLVELTCQERGAIFIETIIDSCEKYIQFIMNRLQAISLSLSVLSCLQCFNSIAVSELDYEWAAYSCEELFK